MASEWRDLCIYLGLTSMDEIEHDCRGVARRCLERSLSVWLRRKYNHGEFGQPSWRKLIEALSNINYTLAKTLAEKHPQAGMF